MGMPVVTVASGGMPVTDVTATTGRGTPVSEAASKFGQAVTKVASGGMAVTFETLVVWPPVIVSDPDYSNVVLLAGWEATNGATIYSEEKNVRAVTFASGARISTAQFRFGASCFDYNGGSCSLADNIDWKLSSTNSDQFCIEMWLRPTTATPGTVAIVGQDFGIGDRAFYLATIGNQLEFQGSADGNNYVQWAVSSGLTWVANTWYHVAVSKDATGKVRLFRDGVMLGSGTPANSAIFNAAQPMNFGSRLPGGSPWPGFMDETRITKGVARYSSDGGFTPPTAAFPRS